MAAAGPHISISAELVTTIAGLQVNNSMLTSLIVSGLLIGFALWVRLSLKSTSRPTGVQNVAEWMVESLYGLVHSVTGNTHKSNTFFPLVASFFLFIALNNWFGLLPGVGTIGFQHVKGEARNPWNVALLPATMTAPNPVRTAHAATSPSNESDPASPYEKESIFVPYFRAGTADLNMTLALGLLSMGAVQFFGLQFLSLSYLQKFFNFSSPIGFFVGILELSSEFSKVLSFAFRLFGNIFAGEVLLVVISYIAALIAPMPFYGLEIFVGLIQALVFSMLSVVLYNMATTSHDEH